MGTRVPYSTDFKDLQKVYDSLIGTVKVAEDFINEEKLKMHRKITKINYDNETKKMMIDYDDGPYPKQIMLCHDCSLLFKKYLDAFWKK